jgi:porphyrinogen peroxidase
MTGPQGGIFALGTASHAYLEFDLVDERDAGKLVGAIAALREPRTTMGSVNLASGFSPELWHVVAPEDAPKNIGGFVDDIIGVDGFVMPATQHDAVLWLSGGAYDVIFDTARAAIAELATLPAIADETSSWPYRHDLDLTGFIDGTENPTLIEASDVVVISEGRPGAGGTILLLQKWMHDANLWESLPLAEQERVIGRTKDDSTELPDKQPDSHVGSTDQERFRQDLPTQHALRDRDRPRNDVRRLPGFPRGESFIGHHSRPPRALRVDVRRIVGRTGQRRRRGGVA